MKLSEIVRNINATLLLGRGASADMEILSVCVDSRLVSHESIFAPILGYKKNGADYVNEAYIRGCRVYLSETNAEPKDDCAIIKVKNLRKSVAELSNLLVDFKNKKLNVIGITGTKGKTGVAVILSGLLSSAGVPTYSVGTLGVLDKDSNLIRTTMNTTPEPTELFSILSECKDSGAEAVALEVSSQAIKDFRIWGIDFHSVIFTSLGIDHIGSSEHESFTEYIRAKRSLFTDYKHKLAFFNADDFYTPFMSFGTEKCIKCGFSKTADFKITDYLITEKGSEFKINGVSFSSKMHAKYDAVNSCLAIAAASLYTEKPLSYFKESFSQITIPGRYEKYYICDRCFIIDYAHNALSFSSVFGLTRKLFSGKIIAVFGSVGERSKNRRRELAEIAEKFADYSIITLDNPGFESPEKICAEIFSFYKTDNAEVVLDRKKAILRAYEHSSPNDAILILGRGNEAFMDIMGRKIPLSDRDIIMNIKAGIY